VGSKLAKLITNRGVILVVAALAASVFSMATGIHFTAGLWDGG
jgi:hypothetical protein